MILSNAQDLIYNGASVNSVWYNQTKIWPTAEPLSYWTAMGECNLFVGNSATGNSVYMKCTAFTGDSASVLSPYTFGSWVYKSNGSTDRLTEAGSGLKSDVVFKNFYLRLEHKTIARLFYASITAKGISPFSQFIDGSSATSYSSHTSVRGVTARTNYGIYNVEFSISNSNSNANSTAVVITTATAKSASLSKGFVTGSSATNTGTYGVSPNFKLNSYVNSMLYWTASGAI